MSFVKSFSSSNPSTLLNKIFKELPLIFSTSKFNFPLKLSNLKSIDSTGQMSKSNYSRIKVMLPSYYLLIKKTELLFVSSTNIFSNEVPSFSYCH